MTPLGKKDHSFADAARRPAPTLATGGTQHAHVGHRDRAGLTWPRRRPLPLLSIVVPTKNELGNVAALIERLETVLPTVAMEIVFVDAST